MLARMFSYRLHAEEKSPLTRKHCSIIYLIKIKINSYVNNVWLYKTTDIANSTL